eukprot:1726320-Amphidinium_carterae.1
MPLKTLLSLWNSVTSRIARMPPSGSAPAKRLSLKYTLSAPLKPLSGSIPVKQFLPIINQYTDSIARMLSGSAPVKPFASMSNHSTDSIARMPPSGSAP